MTQSLFRSPLSYATTFFLQTLSMILLGITVGCGGGTNLPEGDTGTVSGKVTFEGKAAVPKGGSIVFIHQEKGITASAPIAADGSYSLRMRGGSDILVGPYQVGISPPAAAKLTPEEANAITLGEKEPPAPKEWPSIPLRYRSPESSGETFEVKQGSNTYDLNMKNKG